MEISTRKCKLAGEVTIPGSKSHTLRGLIIALLARGESRLLRPLVSSDTESGVAACRALGAVVDVGDPECWTIRGTAGRPVAAPHVVDVGNSGVTLRLGAGAAALAEGLTEFTGDEQIRRSPVGPLLEALRALGATAYAKGGDECAPLVVGGGLTGGRVSIECPTSQYLSSLLICCPLASGDTEIDVPLLHEKPFVGMTCRWLQERGIRFEAAANLQHFRVPGGQSYEAFERAVPADFSSAAFFMVAAAVTGSEVLLRGLDMADTQGDKAIVGMLEEMGCAVGLEPEGLRIRGPERLRGASFDLNATPDALPAMAVAGCLAEGETRLTNVPQARMQETDRLRVMAEELTKMGAQVEELPDGLVLKGGALRGTRVEGHDDHRVVMSLAVAGMAAEGATTVGTAEAVSVTFPTFPSLMSRLGAAIRVVE